MGEQTVDGEKVVLREGAALNVGSCFNGQATAQLQGKRALLGAPMLPS